MNARVPLVLSAILIGLLGTTTLPAKPPALRAKYLVTVADDFIVDAYRNGRKIDDSARALVGEIHGATIERIDVPVYRGDWLVFNVVNNRLRWNGSYFFAVAGMLGPNEIGFASNLKSGDWSYCDAPEDAGRFILKKSFGAKNAAVAIGRVWGDGPGLIRQHAGEGWNGDPVWGYARNTWIKVIVR